MAGSHSGAVAWQEVNVSHRDDVASGTPPPKARQMVLSHAATKAPGARENKKLIARYDVSVALLPRRLDWEDRCGATEGPGPGSFVVPE